VLDEGGNRNRPWKHKPDDSVGVGEPNRRALLGLERELIGRVTGGGLHSGEDPHRWLASGGFWRISSELSFRQPIVLRSMSSACLMIPTPVLLNVLYRMAAIMANYPGMDMIPAAMRVKEEVPRKIEVAATRGVHAVAFSFPTIGHTVFPCATIATETSGSIIQAHQRRRTAGLPDVIDRRICGGTLQPATGRSGDVQCTGA